MTHHHVRLADLSIVGEGVPPELVGLAPASLSDLSAALNPCPAKWQGLGIWPTLIEADPYDPATHTTGALSAPVADPARKVVIRRPAIVPLPPPAPKYVLTPTELRRRFTLAERVAFDNFETLAFPAEAKQVLRTLTKDLELASEIDLRDQDTIDGVSFLESITLIGPGRAAIILSGL